MRCPKKLFVWWLHPTRCGEAAAVIIMHYILLFIRLPEYLTTHLTSIYTGDHCNMNLSYVRCFNEDNKGMLKVG